MEVLKADYSLNFTTPGFDAASRADKSIRDNSKLTAAQVTAAATAATRASQTVARAATAQAAAVKAGSDRVRMSLAQHTVGWDEAAAAATRAANQVAKAQQLQATRVGESVNKIVEDLRKQKLSYKEITDTLSQYNIRSRDVSAAVVRQAGEEVTALNKVVAIRNKLRGFVGLAVTETGRGGQQAGGEAGGRGRRSEESGLEHGVVGGVSRRLRSGAGYVTGGFVGGLAGYASVAGIKSAIEATANLGHQVQFLTSVTGMNQKQAAAWVAVTQSYGVSTNQLAETFRVLGTGATKAMKTSTDAAQVNQKQLAKLQGTTARALTGSKTAAESFVRLGITQAEVAARQNNIPALYALVTQRLGQMKDGVMKTYTANELLGSSQVKVKTTTNAAAKAFADLGISQDEIRKRQGNMSDLLGLVADKLNKMPGGLRKTTDEAALLGRSYQNLNPLLLQGSKGMEEQRKQAEAYGISVGSNATNNALKLEDAQVKLKMASLGLQVQFAEHLAPTIISVISTVVKLSASITSTLKPVVHSIIDDIKDTAHWFKENKVALYALIGVAGSIGGLMVLSATLKKIGEFSRGLKSDWNTLKTVGSVMWEGITTAVSKARGTFDESAAAEDKAVTDSERLNEILDKLAATYGTVAEAALAAGKAQAGAAEGALAASEGSAMASGQMSLLEGGGGAAEAKAITAGERGLMGDAATAAPIIAATTQQTRNQGLWSAFFGRNATSKMGQGVGEAAKTAGRTATATELTAAESGAMLEGSAAPGLLAGMGGKLLGGLGMAGMGLMGVQMLSPLASSVFGRRAGGILSGVGTGASIGAGLGSILPGPGTLVGGLAGGAIGGLVSLIGGGGPSDQEKKVASIQRQMQAAAKSGNVAQLQKLEAEANKTANSFAKVSNKSELMGRSLTRTPDLSKQIKQLHDLSRAGGELAQQSTGTRVSAFVGALAGVQMPDAAGMMGTFTKEFGNSSSSLKDAGAAAMLQLAQGMEAQGKLPRNSVTTLIKDLEGQFPGLQTYLNQQGLATDSQVATNFKMAQSRQQLQNTVNALKQEFGYVPSDAQVTSANMVSEYANAFTKLKQVASDGTTQARAIASKQMQGLQKDAATYFGQMTTNIAGQMANQTKAIQSGSQQAAAAASTNFTNLATSISREMAAGVLSTQQGMTDIIKAMNATLQAFGERPLSGAALRAVTSSPQSAASWFNLQTKGATGSATGPGHMAVGGWVSGDSHRDGTLALLSGNEFVMTGGGQAMMEAAAPGLLRSIAINQPAHFATGGFVDQIPAPTVHGGGEVGMAAQGALNAVANIANAVANQMTSTAGGGGAVPGNLTGPTGQRIAQYFRGQGFSRINVAGLSGNWMQESGLSPNATNSIGAIGLAQWLGDRKQGLLSLAAHQGTTWNNLNTQLQFADQELNGPYHNAFAAAQAAKSPAAAAAAYFNLYEIAGDASLPARQRYAQQAFAQGYRGGGFVGRFQNGGFPGNFTPAWTLPGGWSGGSSRGSSGRPKGLSLRTVPGTGIRGIVAQHEYVSATGALVGSTYQGYPVVSQRTYDEQRAAYQSASGRGKIRKPEVPKDYIVPGTGVGGVPARLEHVTPSVYREQELQYRLHKPQKATALVQSGKGLTTTDAFFQAYLNALDPTTGMSQATLLTQADIGATLRPRGSTGAAGGLGLSGMSVTGGSANTSGLGSSMLNVANQIRGRPYVFGGGHPPTLLARGYDCSGAVSTVINLGGRGRLPMVPPSYTTDQLKTWGVPGPGKDITVGVWGTSGSHAHTMLDFYGHYFESGGGPLGPHFDSGWSMNFPIKRHPPGFREGGMVGNANMWTATRSGGLPPMNAISRWQSGGSVADYWKHTSASHAGTRAAHVGAVGIPRGVRPPHAGGLHTIGVRPVRTPTGHGRTRFGPTHSAGRTVLAPLPANLNYPMQPTSAGALPGAAGNIGQVVAQMPIVAFSMAADATHKQISKAIASIHSALEAIASHTKDQLVRAGMAQLDKALNDTHTTSYAQLTRLADSIQSQLGKLEKGKQTTAVKREEDRLTQALRLVQGAEGARVGALVASAVNEQQALATAQQALTNLMNRSNISSTSAQGTAMTEKYQKQVVAVLRDSVSKLQQAYKMALKAHDPKAATDIQQKLAAALGDLDTATGNLVQDHVAAIEAAAQQISDAAQHNVTMTSGNTAQIQAYLQSSYGKVGGMQGDQTVAGGQWLASNYQAQATAIQGQISALQSQQQAAQSVGDQTLATQIAEAIQQAQGSYQQAMIDATNAIKTGVEGQAQFAVDAATHTSNMASTGEQTLSLQQQLAKDQNTPGAAAAMSSYITQSIIPALKGELVALQQQLTAAQSVNDTTLATQIGEAIANQQNSILQAQLDAQNAIQQATQQTANNTNLSGQLGVSFQNEIFPDLAGMLSNGV